MKRGYIVIFLVVIFFLFQSVDCRRDFDKTPQYGCLIGFSNDTARRTLDTLYYTQNGQKNIKKILVSDFNFRTDSVHFNPNANNVSCYIQYKLKKDTITFFYNNKGIYYSNTTEFKKKWDINKIDYTRHSIDTVVLSNYLYRSSVFYNFFVK